MSITTTVAGKPTIVLVHGAFAESSSWAGVVSRLLDAGYRRIPILAQRPADTGRAAASNVWLSLSVNVFL